MILTSRKIAITQRDDGDNGGDDTTVVLSVINEGADGSVILGFTNEHTDLSIEGNQTYTNSATPSLDLRALKPTGDAYSGQTEIAQIEEWVSEQTPVYITVLTLDGTIQFGDYGNEVEAVLISANEQLSNNDIYAVRANVQTESGYNSDSGLHQNGVWAGVNLLGGYNFQEGETTGIAGGWSKTGGTTSFSSGDQTFSTTGTSDVYFYRDIFFPFEEQVTASVNVVSASITDSASLDIVAYDASDSIIGSASVEDITSTGAFSVSKTLPSGTQYVRVRIKVNDASVTFDDPMLSLGTNTNYTKL